SRGIISQGVAQEELRLSRKVGLGLDASAAADRRIVPLPAAVALSLAVLREHRRQHAEGAPELEVLGGVDLESEADVSDRKRTRLAEHRLAVLECLDPRQLHATAELGVGTDDEVGQHAQA